MSALANRVAAAFPSVQQPDIDAILAAVTQFVRGDRVLVRKSKTVHQIGEMYRLHGVVYAEVWNPANRRTREVPVSDLVLVEP